MGHLQITRLRLEQVRRFREPFEIADFSPGLNILAGPNEAGKSTLVRAIRAAFFERHRSTAVEHLRPWGEGGTAAPRIELDFLLDGEPHHLVKSFLGRKRCTLQIGSRTLDGTDAEDHLAQRLGFSFASKGASKVEHWGIPGLLWVEQGQAQQLDVAHAREHLHDALHGQANASAAALATTGGDEVLALLQAQRAELLTGTGRPRAALLEAGDAAIALQARLAGLDEQIARYRQQVDQLTALRRQHRADDAAQPWRALRQQLDAARQQFAALQDRQAQTERDREQLRQLDQTRVLLAQEIAALTRQQEDVNARAQACDRAAAQLRDADAALDAAARQADAARQRAAAARTAGRAARDQARHAELLRERDLAQAGIDRTAAALATAQAAEQALAAERDAHRSAPAVDAAQLKRLLLLERAERDARLQRQFSATRLRFTLPPGQSLRMQTGDQTQSLQDAGEHWLDGPATLTLPGGGELVVTPGGDGLARGVQAHEAAQDALRTALTALGVADVADAQARQAAFAEREQRLRLGEQALQIVAPQGLAPLRDAVSDAQARLATVLQALALLPPMPEADGPATHPAATADAAEAEQDAATAAEQAAATHWAEAQRLQAAAHSQHDTAVREHAAARAAADDPARHERQKRIEAQWLATGADHQALSGRIAQDTAQGLQARPDILAQDIERLQRSVEQLMRDHQQRREQILTLDATLQQAGGLGLEEQRETVFGELTQATRRHDELQRRASALDLLCSRLEDKRQATLARLQAPLQDRLQHYLPLLLPGARMQMAADLAPGTLTRVGPAGTVESGQVDDLSFGAREQLGVISRFAYADLLRQAGRPTLLILDDTLVHSDAQRLAAMKRVLFDAAQRHQVLLFTCHPEDWRDMGVPVRSLGG